MFTGLVEELGTFVRRDGDRFRFAASTVLTDTVVDDSIAVNGCCLTVVALGADAPTAQPAAAAGERASWFEADAVAETQSRTTLGGLRPGDPVNLERAARYADRLGGHIVAGHVDGVGVVEQPAPDMRVALPAGAGLGRYLVEKGSVTVDGVSLTCFDVSDDSFAVALIPHTIKLTTLGCRQAGDEVNLEVDLLAKHVERLLTAAPPQPQSSQPART